MTIRHLQTNYRNHSASIAEFAVVTTNIIDALTPRTVESSSATSTDRLQSLYFQLHPRRGLQILQSRKEQDHD